MENIDYKILQEKDPINFQNVNLGVSPVSGTLIDYQEYRSKIDISYCLSMTPYDVIDLNGIESMKELFDFFTHSSAFIFNEKTYYMKTMKVFDLNDFKNTIKELRATNTLVFHSMIYCCSYPSYIDVTLEPFNVVELENPVLRTRDWWIIRFASISK